MYIKGAQAYLVQKPPVKTRGTDIETSVFELWLNLPQLQPIFSQSEFEIKKIDKIRLLIGDGNYAVVEGSKRSPETVADILRNPPRTAPEKELIIVAGNIVAHFEESTRANDCCEFYIEAQDILLYV